MSYPWCDAGNRTHQSSDRNIAIVSSCFDAAYITSIRTRHRRGLRKMHRKGFKNLYLLQSISLETSSYLREACQLDVFETVISNSLIWKGI